MLLTGRLIVSLLLLLAISGAALAQDSLNVRLRGEVHHFIEQSHDVAMHGSYAYIASGLFSGLRILDLSDPTLPVEVGYSIYSETCPGVEGWMANKVRVSGCQAYVLYFDGFMTAGHYRLCVYDVSVPGAPRQLGDMDLPDECTGHFAAADRVYVTAMDFESFCGVKVIDVSDPLQPVEVGSFTTPGYAHGAYVRGDTAYVADSNALVVYDVTYPGAPIELGSYSPAGGSALIKYVAVQGDYVFLIDVEFGVRILDASNISQMWEVASIPHHQTDAYHAGLVVSGDRAYYLQQGDDMVNRLIILDVSDPTAPVEAGTHDMPAVWWFHGLDCRDGYACVAAGSDGLRVVDVSVPASTSEVGHYDPYDLTFGAAVSGDCAFVSARGDSDNVLIYDVSDPSSPAPIGSLSLSGRPMWMSVWQNHLYVPGVEIDLVSGVEVLDISNPAEPVEVAFWPLPPGGLGVPLNVERFGAYAFVATAYGGVQIYDVSLPGQPIALGSWTRWDPVTNPGFGVRNVKVAWPYLFAPDEAFGLYVLDVSDPANIVEAASHASPGSAWWVDKSSDNHHVYLADGAGGLRVFDVENPLTPVEVGFVEEGLEHANHVVVAGDSAYVTDGQGIGLHVYNVYDPREPTEVAYHRTPGAMATDIALGDGLVYLSDCTHFEILELIGEPTDVRTVPPTLVPAVCRIRSVRPNPLNAAAEIAFVLAGDGHVMLDVYNTAGRRVGNLLDGYCRAGHHAQTLQVPDLASGTYFLRLAANGRTHSYRVTLVK